MNEIIKHLKYRRDELKNMHSDCVKRLSKLKYKGNPKYHIKIDSTKEQIYLRTNRDRTKGKYIQTKNLSGAKQIAEYDYLVKTLKIIENELKHIEKTIAVYDKVLPEDYYSTLCQARQKLIKPIIPTVAQFIENWCSQPYVPKPFDENDETDFRTVKDERVRSKSEILIANALERKGVPYKYECPIIFNELGVIHPDFTALNVKKRKVIYWEHLGKMDDPDYARKNTFRINVYQKHGCFLGDSLIVTMETSTFPLDVKLVDELINHYLLE